MVWSSQSLLFPLPPFSLWSLCEKFCGLLFFWWSADHHYFHFQKNLDNDSLLRKQKIMSSPQLSTQKGRRWPFQCHLPNIVNGTLSMLPFCHEAVPIPKLRRHKCHLNIVNFHLQKNERERKKKVHIIITPLRFPFNPPRIMSSKLTIASLNVLSKDFSIEAVCAKVEMREYSKNRVKGNILKASFSDKTGSIPLVAFGPTAIKLQLLLVPNQVSPFLLHPTNKNNDGTTSFFSFSLTPSPIARPRSTTLAELASSSSSPTIRPPLRAQRATPPWSILSRRTATSPLRPPATSPWPHWSPPPGWLWTWVRSSHPQN